MIKSLLMGATLFTVLAQPVLAQSMSTTTTTQTPPVNAEISKSTTTTTATPNGSVVDERQSTTTTVQPPMTRAPAPPRRPCAETGYSGTGTERRTLMKSGHGFP